MRAQKYLYYLMLSIELIREILTLCISKHMSKGGGGYLILFHVFQDLFNHQLQISTYVMSKKITPEALAVS